MNPAVRIILSIGAGLMAASSLSGARPSGEAAVSATFSDVRYETAPGTPKAIKPGDYRNPVISGSASDPSIVRVGKDYYLATSSFNHWPALPIFHSRDLVNWTQVGAALSRPGQMKIEGLDGWQGIYAPDLKWHDGHFYLTGTCYSCGGNFIITAERAEGPWSQPTWLPFDGIDPSIFFDQDGRAYVINNGLPPGGPQWDGHRAIWLQELDLRTMKLVGERTVLVNGGTTLDAKPFWIEGPHLIRRDGKYILICAEGGTKENHHEVAFRADTLHGPYVERKAPILTQAGLNPSRANPVVQAGHADLVQKPEGDWWAVFLASRPFGPTELDYTTGRETFLLPVSWEEGWPVILPPGKAVPLVAQAPRFAGVKPSAPVAGEAVVYQPSWRNNVLDSRWVMLGSPRQDWWHAGNGQLRLTATTASLGAKEQPAFLALRQSDYRATLTATVRFPVSAKLGAKRAAAGLAAFAGAQFYWAILVVDRPDGAKEVRLIRQIGKDDPEGGRIVARAPLANAVAAQGMKLRITANGPELIFSYASGRNDWKILNGVQDGRTLAVSRTGGFVGTRLGMTVLDASE